MFGLPPSTSKLDNLQLLADAIDALCEILNEDREMLIEDLTEIVKRQADFEKLRRNLGREVEPNGDF